MRQVLIRRIARLGDMAASYANQESEPAAAVAAEAIH
jgi:hypothetical protein